MDLNSNFNQRAIVHAAKMDWLASPMKGVDRRMLDRLGDEVARATTIVRYAPESHFSPHCHTGGEEFFVLDGVFQDEHGDYPTGTYVRNPPTTGHTPGSKNGCTILVKLWQFDMEDRNQFSIDTNKVDWNKVSEKIETMPLHEDDHEIVCLECWKADSKIKLSAPKGIEVFVLDGGFDLDLETFAEQSWLRLPAGDEVSLNIGSQGCKVWIKRNHLAQEPKPPQV